jgi:hypothetical protein
MQLLQQKLNIRLTNHVMTTLKSRYPLAFQHQSDHQALIRIEKTLSYFEMHGLSESKHQMVLLEFSCMFGPEFLSQNNVLQIIEGRIDGEDQKIDQILTIASHEFDYRFR